MYATADDMIKRYGVDVLVQLTDLSTPQTRSIVTATLTARLQEASDEIDGYLAGRTAVPMAAPPAHIKGLCCRLAYGMLVGDTANDAQRADIKDVRTYLMSVARGDVLLSATQEPPVLAGDAVEFSPGTKYFGREAA